MLNINATSLEYMFLIMLSVLVVSRKDSIFPPRKTDNFHYLCGLYPQWHMRT